MTTGPPTPTSRAAPGRWRAPRLRLDVRAWLVLLVLVAAVPGAFILFRGAAAERDLLRAQVSERLRRTAAAAAQRITETVERAHGATSALASLPGVRSRDGERCSAAARRLVAQEPAFVNASAAGLDGVMFCSALPAGIGVDVSDRAFFRRALESDRVVIGHVIVSRTFKRPALQVARVVRDDRGDRVAVVFIALDLSHLDDLLGSLAGPADVLTAVDGTGAVAAQHPAVGTPDASIIERMLRADDGFADVAGSDGVDRMTAFAPVRIDDAPTDLKVSASTDRAVALAPVHDAFRRSLLLYGMAVALGVVAAWLLGEFELNRPLRRIREAAGRISAADLGARVGAVGGPLGVDQLACAFDEMAERVEKLSRENSLLLDSVGVGICGVDRDGLVTFVNPAAQHLLGFDAGELLGTSAHELCPAEGEHGRDAPCALLATIEDGDVHRIERAAFRRRGGGTVTVQAISTPLRDRGEVVGAVLTFHDVTEHVRLEAQLRHAQKMEAVGRLAGGIAHDFNNLLTVILSAGRALELRAGTDAELRADAEEVVAAAGRGAALTRQLLAFSRTQPLTVAPSDVDAIVERWHPLARRLLGEDVETLLRLGAKGRVLVDPGQLEQVLMNLAVNARDAMPDGGRLTIETSDTALDGGAAQGRLRARAGRYVLLSVSDTGTGMDEDTLAQAFEPFFTTKPAGVGTGLGLSTVWGIVKQSGGDIHVYSAPGQGTCFKLYFPVIEDAVASPPPPAAAGALRGSEAVLLVEDDPLVRRIAARELRRAGYEVVEAANAAEAMGAVEGGCPVDALVTDVLMPEGSGPEVADRVRALRPEAGVLFMSGFSGAALAHRRILAGDAAFLEKPFTPEGLLAALRDVLDRRRSQGGGGVRRRASGEEP